MESETEQDQGQNRRYKNSFVMIMMPSKKSLERDEMQRIMHDFTVKSSSGRRVGDRKQAIAIGLSSKSRNCTRLGLKASVKRRRASKRHTKLSRRILVIPHHQPQ